MDTLPLKHTKWSDRLAFDVALMLEGSGESLDEVIERHAIKAEDIITYNKDQVFLKVWGHHIVVRFVRFDVRFVVRFGFWACCF